MTVFSIAVTSYQYDNANRLKFVNGVEYFWDDNGNLLNDGVNTYTYDSANRLKTLSSQSTVSSYQYNGLGDRLTQNGVNYTLDLNTGLTQVLNDGTNQYLYGLGRIAQVNASTLITDYFMTDALGSVRQLTDASGAITLAKSYQPYGGTLASAGSGTSPFAFTGEQVDASGLTYLRARYYSSGDGRFLTRDTWMGEYNRPLSLNRWMYVEGNPINFTDPSGQSPACDNGDWDRCGIPDWWKRRSSHLYVEGYGYFDTGHLQRGWGSAKWIEESIDALVEGGEIHLSSKEGQPPKEVYWVDYGVTGNIKTLDKAQKISIMYGIYIDFERGYEYYQLSRGDRFPSAFSPEDLPSDHLGFWAYTHGLTKGNYSARKE